MKDYRKHTGYYFKEDTLRAKYIRQTKKDEKRVNMITAKVDFI